MTLTERSKHLLYLRAIPQKGIPLYTVNMASEVIGQELGSDCFSFAKWIWGLNIYDYTHRLGPLSALIGGVFLCGGLVRLIPGQSGENELLLSAQS